MIKPVLRAIKFKYLHYSAQYLAARTKDVPNFPVVFLVGCGRSGTTLAGRILSTCPEIDYYNEPYHFWLAIHPNTDVANLYRIGDANYFLGADNLETDRSDVFRTLFHPPANKIVLEKTPQNACRIGFLKQLAPEAKFLNIVRNGMMVCSSIRVAAQATPYRIFGKPNLNVWWGHKHAKWFALKNDSIAAGYVNSDDASLLVLDEQKAALEWIVSILEFQKWKKIHNDSCCEFLYEDLVNSPQQCLKSICSFLGITDTSEWLVQSSQGLRGERNNVDIEIRLPEDLLTKFNSIQERYGFCGRALPL